MISFGGTPDSPDTLVAAVSEANNAILVTMDGDAKTIASRYGVGSRRYRRLSILRFERCRESRAAKRIDEAMSLIEHEWEVGGGRESQDRRMFVVITDGRNDSHQPLERRALSLNGLLLQEVSDYGAPNLQVRAAFHRRQRRYRILVDDQVIDRPPGGLARRRSDALSSLSAGRQRRFRRLDKGYRSLPERAGLDNPTRAAASCSVMGGRPVAAGAANRQSHPQYARSTRGGDRSQHAMGGTNAQRWL